MTSVCLAVIARNEESNIAECLESAHQCGITHAVVVDTGSTDGTMNAAWYAINRLGMDGHVVIHDCSESKLDFSRMRNLSLSAAHLLMPDYIFWLDADDRVHGRVPENLTEEAYNIPVAMGWTKWVRPHLISAKSNFRFEMPIHEYLNCSPEKTLTDLVVMVGEDRRQRGRSFEKDAALLREYIDQHPNHARATFYLAQSYRDAGRQELAREWYRRRVQMRGGYRDEVFYSHLMLAGLETELRWKQAELIAAKIINPWRLEPYRWLAQQYLDAGYLLRHREEVRMGLLMARQENSLSEQGLFVDSSCRGILEEFERNLHAQIDSTTVVSVGGDMQYPSSEPNPA